MPTNINADTVTGGAVITGDTSGVLQLQSGGVTGLTVNGANVTTAGNLTVTGSITATGGGIPSLASPLAVIGNSTAGAEIRLPEDTDNGANYIALKAPNSLASNLTFTLPSADGTNGQVLQTNGSGTLAFASVTSGPVIEFARQFVTQSTTSWTVPTGVTSIRLYACGKGGDGGTSGGGGGGGFGFGTLAVTAGQVIDVTISAGVATVARSGTTLITANPGNSGSSTRTGGTATISGSLTSGGAFTGGTGGSTNGGGGSAGSPLGNGYSGASNGGGGGIGGSGTSGGGGGAGGGGGSFAGGGSGTSGDNGAYGRVIPFTDPLLAPLIGTGGRMVQAGNRRPSGQATDGQPGGGGGSIFIFIDSVSLYGGNGGFGGGGGYASASTSSSAYGGWGGALGGGGGTDISTGSGFPGSSLAGGGGGGSASGGASGGPATVWILY